MTTSATMEKQAGYKESELAMARRPVRIGVQIHPQQATYKQIRGAVRRVEDAGADIVLNWDHFVPLHGDLNGPCFEAWTMLAAWAEQTSQIQLSCLVTCNAFRNPDLLADMLRTVDHISDGRVLLGIGAGWHEREFVEYGYKFGTAANRLSDLADALPRITTRLKRLNPPPTRQIPVIIGGGGERKTLRIVAQHADVWHSFPDPTNFTHKLAVLNRHCAEIGRNPDEIEIAVGVGGLGREGRSPDPPELEGQPWLDHGATLFTMGLIGPDYNLAAIRPWLAWRDQTNANRSTNPSCSASKAIP